VLAHQRLDCHAGTAGTAAAAGGGGGHESNKVWGKSEGKEVVK
jgi:hypothetical protein